MTAAALRSLTASLPATVEVYIEIKFDGITYTVPVASIRTECQPVQDEHVPRWPVALVLGAERME